MDRDLRGAGTFKCMGCGLRIDRQENASRNIWKTFLRMWGHGFTPKGAKPNDMLPMNPEGDKGGETQGLGNGSIRINT